MSEPTQEQDKGAHSLKTNQFWFGFSMGILVVFCAVQLFLLLFVVPKFAQIFHDAMPGQTLPRATAFIITGRIALMIIDSSWPVLGAYFIRKQERYAMLWINLGIIWTLLQIGITILALFVPMGGIITVTPDSNTP